MEVIVEADAVEAARVAAGLLVDGLRAQPAAVLGLATGRTVLAVYARLARAFLAGQVSLARVQAFALDEYLGAEPDDPWSFHAYLVRHVVTRTDLRAEALRVPDGLAAKPDAEAARYEAAIGAAGGISLQLLGLGRNGHLGFNEPGAPLDGPTAAVPLASETVRANRHDLPPRAPTHAITMGLGTIRAARRCVLLATGAGKARAVRDMLEGPVQASCPASVLQRHDQTTIVVDRPAACLLRR